MIISAFVKHLLKGAISKNADTTIQYYVGQKLLKDLGFLVDVTGDSIEHVTERTGKRSSAVSVTLGAAANKS